MSAQKSMKCQVRALMISLFVALGVSVINSTAKAEDDASRFSYVRLHCTPDNQSHFTDVTAELARKNLDFLYPDCHWRQQADFKGVHSRIWGSLGRC